MMKRTLAAIVIATAASGCSHQPTLHVGPSALERSSCSSINLVNHGHSIFGKNLDNTYETQGLILINKRGIVRTSPYVSTTGARAQWISRYASVSFSFVHAGFVWTGMNEKGLAISMMGIPEIQGPPPDARPPLEDGLWIQYMLDNCVTVADVIEAARDVRIITVDHYHIADRNGDSAVFECLGGEERFFTGDELPISVLTNSTYGGSIGDWEQFIIQPFPPPNGSIERFRIAAQRLQDFTPRDQTAAVDYLFDTLHAIRSEWIYGYPNTTQWSFVFDTESHQVFFRTYTYPGIKHFDLDDFDPRCADPVKMLSVQTPGSGDVSGAFTDLTPEAAYDHFRHFLESFLGQHPSQEQIEAVIDYYLGFPCRDPMRVPRRASRRAQATVPGP